MIVRDAHSIGDPDSLRMTTAAHHQLASGAAAGRLAAAEG